MTRSYLPHTPEDRQAMLKAIGVQRVNDLFCDIPASLRLKTLPNLPRALSEPELVAKLSCLAAKNGNLTDYTCFLGAGAYDHYVPSTVDHVLSRSEFYTAYTQYQPEIAQGYLQALWEYQTMICELTGLPVANASLYDGGTALAEAALMACSANRRQEVIVAGTVHPFYREVLRTYGLDRDIEITEVPWRDGVTDLAAVEAKLSKKTAAVLVQTPNFFGSVEDLAKLAELAHGQGAYCVAAVDPISLGILAAPGTLGADIVVGEGQPLGIPVSFGGPYLGFMATTEKLMRKMPGRLVGKTVDQEGASGFVLTLQAREQHIRREKATSNICSNEALCALAAAVYLSTVGKQGLRQVAELSLQKAHYAYRKLTALAGCETVFSAPFFKEFVVKFTKPVDELNQSLWNQHILGGLDLGRFYPELSGSMLLCVTEKRTKGEIDTLVKNLEAVL